MKNIRLPEIVRSYETDEKIILRDYLALERTTLANVRTLFAYIRTSLYLILAGVAFLEMKRFDAMHWIGYILFGISVLIIIFGIIRYFVLKRKLSKFYEKDVVE